MRRFKGKLTLGAHNLSVVSSQLSKAGLDQIRASFEKVLRLHGKDTIRINNSSKTTQRAKSTNKEEKMKALEEKQRETEEFIKRIIAERKVREKSRTKKLKLEKEREKKKLEEEINRSKSKEEEALRQRKEVTMKLYERIKKEREKDQKRNEELRRDLCKSSQGPYLYKKLESKYNMEVILPGLEEKKRELAKKRDLYKAIDKKLFESHAKKYGEMVAEREESRKKELRAKKDRHRKFQEEIGKLSTPGIERLKLEQAAEKEEQKRKEQKKKEFREKVEHFINKVRRMQPMSIKPDRPVETKRSIKNIREIHKNYAKRIKALNILHSSTDGLICKTSVKKITHHIKHKKSVANDKVLDEVKKADMLPKKIDYLSKIKRTRRVIPARYDWLKDLHDESLDNTEKYRRAVGKVNLIEEKARESEAILRARDSREKSPEMYEEVSGLLIDAIKAKLAILEKF